jgi:hypothetical protein
MLGAAVLAWATPSHASYTECTVQKDTVTVNRPGGDYGDPRWTPLEKGEKVAIRSVYNSKTKKEGSKPYDWVFITHWNSSKDQQWGWVPANVLSNCQPMEETP